MIDGIGGQNGMGIRDLNGARPSMMEKWDDDGNGALSTSEAEALFEDVSEKAGLSMSLEDFLAQLDQDGNGEINAEEVQKLRDILGPPPDGPPPEGAGGPGGPGGPKGPPPSPEEMFAKLDEDGSGGIGESELSSFLEEIGKKSGQSFDAAEIMSELDADGDGNLSQEEMEGLRDIIGPPPKPPGGEFEMKNGIHPEDAADKYLTSALLSSDEESGTAMEA